MLYAAPVAGIAGGAVMVVLSAAIYLGSGKLRDFDPALIGYATATVFLAFGATYRFVLWVSNPPARRYFLRGWQAVLRPGTLTRTPALVPRTVASYLLFQSFIRRRGLTRWLAHQSMFWGVILAASVTFPLTFGWIHFRAAAGGQGYAMYMLGVKALSFNAFNWLGWLMFHTLDIAAVLVIAGSGYYLVHRLEDRQVMAHQRTVRDILPLIALLAISFTGLSLTVSTALFHGRSYHVLALVHMAVVVLTLLYLPFGKFFHVIHRTASVGVPVYQATSLQAQGAFACRVCGEPLEAASFVRDLELTMEELDLRYPTWVETCPRCKRVERGIAYRTHLKAGFQ
ncbi:MAG: hypothetical protein NVSMB32_02450 [Actinomycetota bacterium]